MVYLHPCVLHINRIKVEFKGYLKIPRACVTYYINRIKVEFKGYNDDGYLISESNINRIKVEFKVVTFFIVSRGTVNINRIKVEFKDKFLSDSGRNQSILIESKWNLKQTAVDLL